MNNIIEVENLCKHYKDFDLDNVSFAVPAGCIMGLIGENGAGKSTTIHLMLDLIRADSGSVKILGKSNKDKFEITKEDIGVVLDEVGFNPKMTAKKINNIMKYAYKNWDEKLYFEYIEKFGLPPKKKFKDYSKGMKMKLGFAAALSHSAKLLILDEATSGLDPVVRDEITDIIFEFTRDETHGVLISSHIVSDLEKVCDYIAFIHKGKIVLYDEKDRLYEKYAIVNCSEQEFAEIDESVVIGKKVSKYGIQAIVEREKIPHGFNTGSIDIEKLFVFMIKN